MGGEVEEIWHEEQLVARNIVWDKIKSIKKIHRRANAVQRAGLRVYKPVVEEIRNGNAEALPRLLGLPMLGRKERLDVVDRGHLGDRANIEPFAVCMAEVSPFPYLLDHRCIVVPSPVCLEGRHVAKLEKPPAVAVCEDLGEVAPEDAQRSLHSAESRATFGCLLRFKVCARIKLTDEQFVVTAQGLEQNAVSPVTSNSPCPAEPVTRVINDIALPSRIARHIAVLVCVGRSEVIDIVAVEDLLRHQMSGFLDADVFHHISEECSADHSPFCCLFYDPGKVDDCVGCVLVEFAVEFQNIPLFLRIPQQAVGCAHARFGGRNRTGNALHRRAVVGQVAGADVVPLGCHRTDNVVADHPASQRRPFHMLQEILQHFTHLFLPNIRCKRGAVGIEDAIPVESAIDCHVAHLVLRFVDREPILNQLFRMSIFPPGGCIQMKAREEERVRYDGEELGKVAIDRIPIVLTRAHPSILQTDQWMEKLDAGCPEALDGVDQA